MDPKQIFSLSRQFAQNCSKEKGGLTNRESNLIWLLVALPYERRSALIAKSAIHARRRLVLRQGLQAFRLRRCSFGIAGLGPGDLACCFQILYWGQDRASDGNALTVYVDPRADERAGPFAALGALAVVGLER